jgi:hypothetical protein
VNQLLDTLQIGGFSRSSIGLGSGSSIGGIGSR